MTVLIDGRPAGLDAFFRPGNTFTVTLTWQDDAGAPVDLDGRTFEAALDAVALAVTVLGDTMTVIVTEAQTAAAAERGVFLLTETTAALDDVLIAGSWGASDGPAARTSAAATVVVGAASVAVTVTGGGVGAGFQLGAPSVLGPTAVWPGAIHTAHDALYWWPPQLVGSAEYVPNGATLHAPSLFAFDQTTPEHIKWVWAPGDGWEAYKIRFGIITPGFAAGNGVWRYSEERFVANQGAPAGTTTNTPVAIATQTIAAPAALGGGNFYGDLVTGVVAPTVVGEVILSTIERVANDAGDTCNGDLGVWLVTATREDV